MCPCWLLSWRLQRHFSFDQYWAQLPILYCLNIFSKPSSSISSFYSGSSYTSPSPSSILSINPAPSNSSPVHIPNFATVSLFAISKPGFSKALDCSVVRQPQHTITATEVSPFTPSIESSFSVAWMFEVAKVAIVAS